ncbi:MAG: VOC family protein [Ginsengibacter sp.]
MSVNSKIPEGHQTVMPYLILKGAQKFVEFTENVFNAVEDKSNRHMREENVIMHTEITIGGSTLMLADSTEKFKPVSTTLFVYVDNADETYKKAIDNGAKVITEMSDQSYGRSGGVEDPFGNTWWITSVK